jgi:2-amino-4-hydroxy-6-hydroxymethyldihydropteridine diphosphokinase
VREDGFVALGSNLGDRESHLRQGLAGMARRGIEVSALSSVWETEPVHTREPFWFLNMVARVRAELMPEELLDALLAVEAEAGRVRRTRNAARELDLDLLLFGDRRSEGPRLVLPHPRIWERRFVLAPLAEVAPGLRHPVSGRTVGEVLGALADPHAVRRLGALAWPTVRPV